MYGGVMDADLGGFCPRDFYPEGFHPRGQCRTKGCASGASAQGVTVEGAKICLNIKQICWVSKKWEGGARFMLGTERNYSLVQHC